MKRFQENLIRVGMVIGLWLGIGMIAASSMTAACGLAAGLTILTIGLVAWDIRKAWKEHGS